MHSLKSDEYCAEMIENTAIDSRNTHGSTASEYQEMEEEVIVKGEKHLLLRQQQYLRKGANPEMIPFDGTSDSALGPGMTQTYERQTMYVPSLKESTAANVSNK